MSGPISEMSGTVVVIVLLLGRDTMTKTSLIKESMELGACMVSEGYIVHYQPVRKHGGRQTGMGLRAYILIHRQRDRERQRERQKERETDRQTGPAVGF